MKYKKIEKDNYEIYYYKTDRFKSINLITVLIDDYDKKNITLDNFISNYLLLTNITYKDEISMNKKYLDLYNPYYSIIDNYKDYHYKFFDITFLNEKYIEKGNNKKVIDFYFDIMFNPNNKNNSFDQEQSTMIKNRMKTDYNLMEENPDYKAYFDSMKLLSEDFPIKNNPRGKKSDLNKIDLKNAYKYYLDEIKNSKYMVFVVGNVEEEFFDLINDHLNNVKKRELDIRKSYECNKVKKVEEKEVSSGYNQSIIYLYYKLLNTTLREREIVLPLLNYILGGPSSKLFNNVREKNSLSYYVSSNFLKYYNYLYINAGISYKNKDKAYKLIFKEVDNMKTGNITTKEINDSKKAIEASILEKEDSFRRIGSDMITSILFDKPSSEEIIEETKTVTKKEIVDLSNKLDLDVKYILRGDNNENN